ncbi:MAG TPA: HAD family hydrolase [Candidatus Lokiarchaeia archaeon]|nr:HAD family hydrolase [Candidatus Lokiarchaeia archaeon]
MARFKAVLFDLGGTLVEYYKSSEFQDILERAMNDIQQFLFEKMATTYEQDALWKRVEEENREAGDFRVRPMEDRLVNIFELQDFAKESAFITKLCTIFMKHIFERGNVYPDTTQTLEEIKSRGLKIGLVSNTPWGSPAILWREELGRLRILKHFDVTVFCRDVGWRKPASQVFTRALSMLRMDAKDCVFVGDDPRWDVSGPRAVGMDAVLIDRSGGSHGNPAISNLQELLEML